MKLLIVDDKKVIREGIKGLLLKFKKTLEIQETSNGLLAVNMVLAEDFDIILMDIDMPVMNGITATEHIIKIKPNSIIVGMSLNFENEQSIQIKKNGAIKCLHKESLDISLMDTLKELLPKEEKVITS